MAAKKYVFIMMLSLLIISGCGVSNSTKPTNILNLDKEVFEKGSKVAKYYSEVLDENSDNDIDDDILKWYNEKLESEEYESDEEALFFQELYVIALTIGNYEISSLNTNLAGQIKILKVKRAKSRKELENLKIDLEFPLNNINK